MTAQFCSISSVSTSWKRKTRIIKLAICRQAVFDVMQFNSRDPYFVADPNTFPAFGWFDHLDDCARNPCPFQGNSEEQVNILLSSLSVPEPKTCEKDKKSDLHLIAEVAYVDSHNLWSPAGSDYSQRQEEEVSSHHGVPDSNVPAVDPGVLKEELHDEELQDVGLQNEELLNEQLHYSHHTYYMASRSEVCHTSASDADPARHGKDWQGDLKDFKDEEEENVHVESVESSTAVAAEEASLASQSNDAVLHAFPLDYSLHSAPLDYSLHSVPLDDSRVQREGGGPEALPLASSKTHGECEVDQRKDNCASSSRLCSDELQSNRSECQAARDWARANGDAVALWREFERLPKDEFHARIEALKAYKLRMGIESPEEAPSPEGDAGRGKGQRHRRNRRRARAKAQAVLTGSSMSKSAHPSTCDPPQPPSSFADLCSSSNHVECAGTATTWVLQRHIARLLVADHLQKEDADWDAVFHAWDKMATLRERANFYLKQATLHRLCEAYHRDGEEDADIQRLWEQCRLDKIRMHRIAGWCFGHWRCLTFYSSGAQRLMEQRLQSHIRNLRVTFWPPHDKYSMASHPGSSTTGSLSNAVVSSAVTEDEDVTAQVICFSWRVI
ncbi:unnamed protein product [Prorocentrum cordatum]|uniref:Uncharacterized protein n=1 Tax=Prorocentrum cordatum TaxID=2364126 RepID=A0ABN9X0C7_9DINO|nr:unnamed protein product [Polarella glacialis]